MMPHPVRTALLLACLLGLALPAAPGHGRPLDPAGPLSSRAPSPIMAGGPIHSGPLDRASEAFLATHLPESRSAAQDWLEEQGLLGAGGAAGALQDDPFARVDECMQLEMAGAPDRGVPITPGASIAILKDGELAFTRGYGLRSAASEERVDTETIFRIGSTTKQMTAAAVMQLVEQGKVDLDAPVTRYLPEFELAPPYQASDISLHQLLTHTSGLPDNFFVPDLTISLESWIPALKRVSPHAPAGSFWNYSNPNFSLAGAVVERVAERPYNDYMADELWARLGMTRTTLYADEVRANGNFSQGHEGELIYQPEDFDWPAIGPAGTAFSTPSDMILWAQALMQQGGVILTPESASRMQTPHVPVGYIPWERYGYGIFVTDYQDMQDPTQIVTVYEHGGNVPGYSSQLFWIPERGFAVSILANTIRSLNGSAQCALQSIAGVQTQPVTPLRTGPEDWAPHVGSYAMTNSSLWPFSAQVKLEGESLLLDITDLGRSIFETRDYGLLPAIADTFRVDQNRDGQADSILTFTFMRDEADPSRVRYLRDRYVVGQRVGQFPASLAIQGDACADLPFVAERDMPELEIEAHGLAAPRVEQGIPYAQDDPDDPTSSSFKRDVEVRGGADMAWWAFAAQPGDMIASHLLRDMDGDGEFAYPSELVESGLSQANYSFLYPQDGLPAGQYQLWVQGIAVASEDATMLVEQLLFDGTALSLKGAPETLADGETGSFQVCADAGSELLDPAVGTVSLQYGAPPRRLRVMVDWTPAAAPPSLYLPSLWNVPWVGDLD
jgi:CubicO group peptidase (beta-lactamase class C family)